VGKSSLLNALTRQWGVVRTSDKPGLTQVHTLGNMVDNMLNVFMSI
jgi:GTP-binding protein EngB required for normal cell division